MPRASRIWEVEPLLREGLQHKDIADRLGISPSTVSHYATQLGLSASSKRKADAQFDKDTHFDNDPQFDNSEADSPGCLVSDPWRRCSHVHQVLKVLRATPSNVLALGDSRERDRLEKACQEILRFIQFSRTVGKD